MLVCGCDEEKGANHLAWFVEWFGIEVWWNIGDHSFGFLWLDSEGDEEGTYGK